MAARNWSYTRLAVGRPGCPSLLLENPYPKYPIACSQGITLLQRCLPCTMWWRALSMCLLYWELQALWEQLVPILLTSCFQGIDRPAQTQKETDVMVGNGVSKSWMSVALHFWTCLNFRYEPSLKTSDNKQVLCSQMRQAQCQGYAHGSSFSCSHAGNILAWTTYSP